ncbi:NosD domain-containing protein [Haloplanus salilacus]|uniref:NosD domain-containing protein n=1 Tax=Haloplanus salilacus TaxID=2949994 RepID=UPI0030D4E1E5
MRSTDTRRWQFVTVACVAFLLVASVGSFVVDLGSARPDPVAYDETVKLGLSAEVEQTAEHAGASIPRVEVFYSQYEYVVGYTGVGQAIAALDDPGRERQFGYPLAVYASDYAGRSPRCVGGTLVTATNPDWAPVTEMRFVIGSDARVAGDQVVVPFSSSSDAADFAADCGGRIVDWDGLRRDPPSVTGATDVASAVDDRRDAADRRTATARRLLDREVSVVVGRDAPTIRAAVRTAPPDTTVVVPPGTYAERVVVNRSITLRGEGATLSGGGNGTVVDVRADDVAVTGFTIRGVGNATRSADGSGDGSGDWDAQIQRGYGGGDAGVVARNVSGVYVRNVTVHTPANGVLLRRTPGTVVEGVAVNGTAEWADGFMGVIAMNAPVVVQDSVIDGGRDGVYLHRAGGTVVRNNTFRGQRFGVHLMYTSDTLVADNVARGQVSSGLVVMTRPSGNAIVGNDVRHANGGIFVGGAHSYVADNVVADTDRGLVSYATQTTFEHNVLYGNGVGFAVSTVVPSNRVVDNDFVANDRHATAGAGALRLFTHEGRGNYWEGAYDPTPGDGPTLDRAYAPTDPIDRRLHRTDAAVTLRSAPTVRAIRSFRGTTPGFRRGSIVDTAPLARPANPATLARVRNETGTGGDRS